MKALKENDDMARKWKIIMWSIVGVGVMLSAIGIITFMAGTQ